MRVLFAAVALLFASSAFAESSLAMPQVDVTANRVQHVPPLALTLEPQVVGCDVAIPTGATDASDALQFASGPFTEVADVQAFDRLAPLVSISWSEGLHLDVVGAPVVAWRNMKFAHRVWHATSC
jgi:hypothetical protein